MSILNKSLMLEALKEAKKAEKAHEVPIGAIIYDNSSNKIIARSYNKNIKNQDSTAHAEILAIREACKIKENHRLDNCDIYVTIEPCAMCAGAIILSRIKGLYFGCEDKKSGGVFNGAKVLQAKSCHHKTEIYSGFNEKDCRDLMKNFFKSRR